MITRTARDREWDRLGARAVQVWGECAATGFVLAGAGAFVAVMVAALAEGGTEIVVVGLYAMFVAGFGGGIGLVVGMVVGIPVGLLVRYGEPGLGARAVAKLIPVVALVITVPLTFFLAQFAGVVWAVCMVSLDTVLTLGGALFVARRYLRRSEPTRVH